ncbi:MAG: helix-turn-helix domain-containing protein [Pseudomonadota bacterium]|nr:helix-turn-helix domain-containing protein [Pseudomonadota bacterium]
MISTFKQFKAKALARPDARKAYDELAEEFAFLDEVFKARSASGLTQAEIAARIGTTQSAIARLESPSSNHSPSVVTLQKYARALGYRVEIKLVPDTGSAVRAKSIARRST